jgi:ABC-2 type transport system permease protein
MTAWSLQASRYRYRHAARMEWIKLRSLRSTRWTLLFAIAGTVAVGVAAGASTTNAAGDPTSNILAGIALGQIPIGVLGVLMMTGEYSSGMIRATLSAIPRRPLVLAAKASVFGCAALVAGELATFASFEAGTAALRAGVPQSSLSQAAVLRAVSQTGAYLALIGLIGLGLGAIVRSSAAAIAVLVGIVFVLPVGLARTAAGRYLPELIAANSLSAVKPVARYPLSPWVGLGVICLYAAVLLLVGGWLLARRDA